MPLPLPSVQEPAAGPEIAARPAEMLAAARPFIEGPDMALWVGFGAFIFIFLVVLLVIVRGRVIAPARRKAIDATFFEPAGEDADITFDEPAASPPESARDRRRKRRERKQRIEEPLVFSEPEEAGASEDSQPPDEIQEGEHQTEDIPAPVKKRRSPFAGLFGKSRPKAEQGDLAQAPEDSLAAAATEAPEPDGDEQDAQQRTEFEHAEEIRLEAEEAERLHAVEERDQIYRQAREQAEREAELDRANAEAALEQRMQSVATMQRKLAEKEAALKSGADAGPSEHLSETLEQRFAALSDELNAKLQTTAMTVHASPLTQAAALAETAQPQQREVTAELADFFSREIKSLRDITEDALALLAFKIDQITVTPDGAAELSRQISTLNASLATRTAPSTAGRIQLGDIVRNALPADRYAFSHRLASGRAADCLILAPDATSDAIAIDAHYPVEAFDAYVRAGVGANDKVKNEYRRTILRHIAAVAETLIVPGETENFAVMFAPSEAIFNDLHTNLADVVQDSYRAKVWILSPTSLMATLHMMAAIAGNARRKSVNAAPANDALLSEIAELRQRMASLEEGRRGAEPAEAERALADEPAPELFDAPDDAPAAPMQDMAPEESAFEELQREEALETQTDERVAAQGENLPPFPLR